MAAKPYPPREYVPKTSKDLQQDVHYAVRQDSEGNTYFTCMWEHCTYNPCTGSATRKNGLLKHIHAGAGIRPYQCPQDECKESFNQKAHLTTHMATHTGKRKECGAPGCKFSATDPSSVTRHRKQHHNIQATNNKRRRYTKASGIDRSVKRQRTDAQQQSMAVEDELPQVNTHAHVANPFVIQEPATEDDWTRYFMYHLGTAQLTGENDWPYEPCPDTSGDTVVTGQDDLAQGQSENTFESTNFLEESQPFDPLLLQNNSQAPPDLNNTTAGPVSGMDFPDWPAIEEFLDHLERQMNSGHGTDQQQAVEEQQVPEQPLAPPHTGNPEQTRVAEATTDRDSEAAPAQIVNAEAAVQQLEVGPNGRPGVWHEGEFFEQAKQRGTRFGSPGNDSGYTSDLFE